MIKLVNGTGTWFSTVDKVNLTLQDVTDIIEAGGEVYNYPIFAKMSDATYKETIATELQPVKLDEKYVAPKVEEWLTTKGTLIDGYRYCILSTKKSWIKCSDALKLAETKGVTLLHETDYKKAVEVVKEDVIIKEVIVKEIIGKQIIK